jgi:hypothetical protein
MTAMKTRNLFFSILAAVIFAGCTDDRESTYFSKSFILVFLDPTWMHTDINRGKNAWLNIYGNNVTAYKGGEAYLQLIDKFGDNHYNQMIPVYSNPPYSVYRTAISSEILSMDVKCDKDFDPEHPAGTSLNDIVMFRGKSPLEYIESGYDPHPINRDEGYSPVYKLLSELEPRDMKLLHPSIGIQFMEPPTNKGPYNITFCLNMRDKSISKTFPMEF